ncbi:MAG: tRNA adenosine deaminase-associated protein [Actinomycetes bacterium]
MDEDALDFVLAAWREEGRWAVEMLPPHAADSLEALIHALRQLPGDGGALGFVSVAEEFFIALRVHGADVRLMLSDVTAAHDWPLAHEVANHLGAGIPGDDDLDEVVPAGDLRIFTDLGFGADELDMLCSNLDLYPDQVIASVATRVGFGEAFDAAMSELT